MLSLECFDVFAIVVYEYNRVVPRVSHETEIEKRGKSKGTVW